jgi:hypothetical protein
MVDAGNIAAVEGAQAALWKPLISQPNGRVKHALDVRVPDYLDIVVDTASMPGRRRAYGGVGAGLCRQLLEVLIFVLL